MKDKARLRKFLPWVLLLIGIPIIAVYSMNRNDPFETLIKLAIPGFIGVILLILSGLTEDDTSRRMKFQRWGLWLVALPLLFSLSVMVLAMLFLS